MIIFGNYVLGIYLTFTIYIYIYIYDIKLQDFSINILVDMQIRKDILELVQRLPSIHIIDVKLILILY